MKSSGLFLLIISIFLVASNTNLNAQDINVHELISKNLSTVIKRYGKPAHQDRSNPAMECVFYKTSDYQMVFVANESGVYQAEGSKSYGSKKSALNALNELISKCQKANFVTDTVNVSEYNLQGSGVRMNVSLFENSFSKKYEVKVKANKTES